jgi:hypothetical protein
MERKNLAVELLERLLKDKIKAQTRTNGVGTLLSPSLAFHRHEETTGVSFLLITKARR